MVSPDAVRAAREARQREQAGWRSVAARDQQSWEVDPSTIAPTARARRRTEPFPLTNFWLDESDVVEPLPIPDIAEATASMFREMRRMEDALLTGMWAATTTNTAPEASPGLTAEMMRNIIVQVREAERMRREMARPDGYIEYYGGRRGGLMAPTALRFRNEMMMAMVGPRGCDCPMCRPPSAADRAKRQEAESRSLALFKSWLSPEQLAQFERENRIEVTGCDTGKRYRIRTGTQMNITELKPNGNTAVEICFAPEGNLAIGDVMLAQKIALETMESAALKVANRVRLSV